MKLSAHRVILGLAAAVVVTVAGCNMGGDSPFFTNGRLLNVDGSGAAFVGVDGQMNFTLPGWLAGAGCTQLSGGGVRPYGGPASPAANPPVEATYKIRFRASRYPVTMRKVTGTLPTGVQFFLTNESGTETAVDATTTEFQVIEDATQPGTGYVTLRSPTLTTIATVPPGIYTFTLQVREEGSPQISQQSFTLPVLSCSPAAPTLNSLAISGLTSLAATSEVSSVVTFTYNLADDNAELVNMRWQYRDADTVAGKPVFPATGYGLYLNQTTAGTPVWKDMTPTAGTITDNVPSEPGAGKSMTFAWDSVTDFAAAIPAPGYHPTGALNTPLGFGFVRASVQIRVWLANGIILKGLDEANLTSQLQNLGSQMSKFAPNDPPWPTSLGTGVPALIVNNEPFPLDPGDTTRRTGADILIGQTIDNKNDSSDPANSFNGPSGVYVPPDNSRLFVLDTQNNRVLMFHSPPQGPLLSPVSAEPPAGTPAQPGLVQFNANSNLTVFGQSDLKLTTPKTALNGLTGPTDAYYDSNYLFVVDAGNHRVLVWPASEVTTEPSARSARWVIGQPTAAAVVVNNTKDGSTIGQGGASEYGLSSPTGVCRVGSYVYVSDSGNHRILGYEIAKVTAWNGNLSVPASVVIGQPTFYTAAAKQLGGISSPDPTARNLDDPRRLATDGRNLMVCDANQHRVLVWDPAPTAPSNEAPAKFVIGQLSRNVALAGTGTSGNESVSIPNTGVTTLDTTYYFQYPWGIACDGTTLAVADTSNARIMVYPVVPVANGSPAVNVVGVPDFVTVADVNNTGGGGAYTPSRYNFDSPQDCALAGGFLWVADMKNNRVLRFSKLKIKQQ